jgi:hypothetical protein
MKTYNEQFTGTNRDYLDMFIDRVNKDGKYTVVHRQTTRFEAVNYLAMRDNATDVVHGAVLTVKVNNGEANATLVMESDGPAFVDANVRFINKLSPTTDAGALGWRQQCAAAQAKAAERRREHRGAAQRVDTGYHERVRVKPPVEAVRAHFGKLPVFLEHPRLLERMIAAGTINFIVPGYND